MRYRQIICYTFSSLKVREHLLLLFEKVEDAPIALPYYENAVDKASSSKSEPIALPYSNSEENVSNSGSVADDAKADPIALPYPDEAPEPIALPYDAEPIPEESNVLP